VADLVARRHRVRLQGLSYDTLIWPRHTRSQRAASHPRSVSRKPSEWTPITRAVGRLRCPRSVPTIASAGDATLRSWPIAERSLGRPESQSTFPVRHQPACGHRRGESERSIAGRPAQRADRYRMRRAFAMLQIGNSLERAVGPQRVALRTRQLVTNSADATMPRGGFRSPAVDADRQRDGVRPIVSLNLDGRTKLREEDGEDEGSGARAAIRRTTAAYDLRGPNRAAWLVATDVPPAPSRRRVGLRRTRSSTISRLLRPRVLDAETTSATDDDE